MGYDWESACRRAEQLQELRTLDDPDASLPFIRQILSTLRRNVGNQATVLGFIGTPWTLAAYAMEGSADRCPLRRGIADLSACGTSSK